MSPALAISLILMGIVLLSLLAVGGTVLLLSWAHSRMLKKLRQEGFFD
jgi:hypothetical protein